MAEVQSFTLDLENKGLLISRPGDLLPPGYLTDYFNLTANKTGFIESRGGTSKVSSTQLPGPVSSQGRIIISGAAYIYQGASTFLYRAFSEIATGFSGNPLVMKDGGPDLAIDPHMLVFDSNQRMKDDGTTTTNFGIAGPLVAAAAVSVAATAKVIDDFEYASSPDLNAVWVPTSGTLTTSAVDPQAGTYSGNDLTTNQFGDDFSRAITINLNEFTTPGDSTDQDFISFYLRTDVLSQRQIGIFFDVSPSADFSTDYYYRYFPSSSWPSATGTWTQYLSRKSEFTRAGVGAYDWSTVTAIKIIVGTDGSGGVATFVNLGIDSMQMVSGGTAAAADYDWIYRYKNVATGSTSPFSPEMLSTIAILNGAATLTVVNPRDTQVTTIELYRRGGDNSIFEFVVAVPVTAWTGTMTIVDNYADSALGDTTDLDQVELANLLVTPSVCPKSFLKTTDSGATWTDYTSAVSDDTAGTYADLSGLAQGPGYVIISADGQFRQILFAVDASVNTNSVTLAVEYWNGSSFVSVSNLTDGTADSGKSLAQNGTVKFDFPNDWVVSNIDGIEAYQVRVSWSANLSAAVHVTECRLGANAFDPTVGEVFAGRVWFDDSHHTDRIWYSERFAVEVFLQDNFVVGSTSGDPVVRPYGLDDQLFIFTQKSVDRLIGSTPGSFQPIATGSEMGLFSKYAICKGQGRIYYRGYDGIYALPGSGFSTKLTLAIDPIFHGIPGGTEGELQPIDKDYALTETMEFFDMKIRFGYTATNGTRYEIIYDLETDRYEMTDRPTTSYLRLDDVGLVYSGNSDGYVYKLEDGNTDDGAAIDVRFRTGYLDFGTQSQTKQFTEILIDADLAGETLDFYADLDNGEGSSQNVALTNSSRGPLHFPLDDDTQARNIALRLDSNNGGSLVRFYKATFFYITLPAPLTVMPSDWMDFGYTRWKSIRRVWVSASAATTMTMEIQIDGVSRYTVTFTVGSITGRKKTELRLPPCLKGILYRFIFTSPTGARVYYDQSDVEWRPLAEQRGYQRASLGAGR